VTIQYFRSAPIHGTTNPDGKAAVDREAGIIRGASAMQAGEAKGKGVIIDETSLAQVVELGNKLPSGAKVRFTHPNPASDSLGKAIGRMKNFSVIGDKAVGDIYLSQAAASSPYGDLRSYVAELADEDPESFGMSVCIDAGASWKLDDGSEVSALSADLAPKAPGGNYRRPANAVGPLPFLRISKLKAVDVVDDPAANRDGLFAEPKAAQASITFSESTTTAEFSAEKKESHMKPEELKALKAKHPEHAGLILDMFAESKPESEILGAIKDAQFAALEQSTKDMRLSAEKAEADHKAALAAKDEQIAALAARADKAEKLATFAKGAAVDPGADGAAPVASDVLKKKWDAMSADAQRGFFGDFAVFQNAEALRLKDRQHAGQEV
jgi:hypothetical protein